MTRKERDEAIEYVKSYRKLDENLHNIAPKGTVSFFVTEKCLKYWDMAIKALEQESCEDCISRKAVLDIAKSSKSNWIDNSVLFKKVNELLPVTPQPKIRYCKDCKWWKDSDGSYRRGIDAESRCPINRIEVYEGIGYCSMFEPQDEE